MTPDKPSIAELMRSVDDGTSYTSGFLALQDAAPLLLEIAAAALAWRDQRALNLQAALLRTEAEIEAEAQDVQRALVKRTADLARALEAALSKVTP